MMCITGVATFSVAALLNRAGRYRAAALILIWGIWLLPYVGAFVLSAEAPMFLTSHWSALPSIIIASAIFPELRAIVGIGALNIMSTFLLYWLVGAADLPTLFNPILTLCTVTTCTFVIRIHRSQLEQERRAELMKAIEQLQQKIEEHERLTTGLTNILSTSDELLAIPDLDQLWKRGTELARTLLGLDRNAIFQYDADTGDMIGTYGTNRYGATIAEHGKRFNISNDAWIADAIAKKDGKIWALHEGVELYEFQDGANVWLAHGWIAYTLISNWAGVPAAVMFNENSLSGRPFDPINQNLVGLYCSLLGGIVERKHAEIQLEGNVKALKIAKRMAEESSRIKSEFLSTVSHELRTPLNAIIGFSDMLLMGMNGELNPKQHHKMSRLRENGVRLLTLINNVLDLTRLEARRVEILNKPLALHDLIQRLSAQMDVLAQQKGLQFNIYIDASTPKTILGDEQRLEQVIVNLLSNAFKFTDKGSVTLTVDTQLASNAWRIQVADTGIGIPPHALNIIFEEFRQVDGGFNRAYKGSGLGLSITHNLVQLMNGRITVESTLSAGSTFIVTLPLLNTKPQNIQPQTPSAVTRVPIIE